MKKYVKWIFWVSGGLLAQTGICLAFVFFGYIFTKPWYETIHALAVVAWWVTILLCGGLGALLFSRPFVPKKKQHGERWNFGMMLLWLTEIHKKCKKILKNFRIKNFGKKSLEAQLEPEEKLELVEREDSEEKLEPEENPEQKKNMLDEVLSETMEENLQEKWEEMSEFLENFDNSGETFEN